jgi:3-deoxy-D-manno-octulosonate 8-phosphate phosphatase (KDO 8-P phosphatase)
MIDENNIGMNEIQRVNLREVSKKFQDKLSKIKVLLVDVDGILTNGLIYYSGSEIGFNRFFHALDGYGLKLLMNAGIKVGFVSGGDSVGLRKRGENLKIDYSFLGNEDKRYAFLEVMKDGFKAEEIAFMGDEFFDIPLLKRAGFSATVPLASHEVQEVVDYVTSRSSGQACVREVVDLIRYSQNIVPVIPDFED